MCEFDAEEEVTGKKKRRRNDRNPQEYFVGKIKGKKSEVSRWFLTET